MIGASLLVHKGYDWYVDRLYTAFVSSTYLDLIRERQLVANALLNEQCVPLGMEFFPSTGANQWGVITESITAADFCLFIIAGRYGSLALDLGISWTHREYREAIRQGKPIIVLLHREVGRIESDRVETVLDLRAALEEFRDEVPGSHVCRYYTDDAELLTGLYASIGALRRDGRMRVGYRLASGQYWCKSQISTERMRSWNPRLYIAALKPILAP